ncbi:MAG: prepilin-type N-terminal cleavage/methylation domain-containing protein [Acidobacteriota bacterium]
MKRQQGFSLIELLIVVAVIGIIAAIAVPNLMRSRDAAQEASAISSLRTLATAEVTFAATQGNGQFGDLGELQAAGLIDEALAGGSKDGYSFTMGDTPAAFSIGAEPTSPNAAQMRYFFVDQSCVIRFNQGGAADASSTPLGGTAADAGGGSM